MIDTGSNSTRLWIGDVEGGRVPRELVRRTTVTRLGDGVDADGHLSDAAWSGLRARSRDIGS